MFDILFNHLFPDLCILRDSCTNAEFWRSLLEWGFFALTYFSSLWVVLTYHEKLEAYYKRDPGLWLRKQRRLASVAGLGMVPCVNWIAAFYYGSLLILDPRFESLE